MRAPPLAHISIKLLLEPSATALALRILQSVSLFAAMDSGGFGYDTIAIQVTATLVGGTLLAIFPGILSKLHPRRLFAPADPLMAGIATE